MEARITITGIGGTIYEGTAQLLPQSGKESRQATGRTKKLARGEDTADFDLPIRPFMKRYGAKLSGPEKFTLLLSKLVQGNIGQAIAISDVQKAWDRMTNIMGGRFNRAYTTRAKDNGWVDSSESGSYALRAGWSGILHT